MLFLLVFAENFLNELKSFFERTIIINISKSKTERIEKIKNEKYIVKDKNNKPKEVNRYEVVYESENTIRFEGRYYWEYDLNVSLFRSITNTTTVADNFSYMVKKHGLNEYLKPYQIRSLCFTMLKDQFTFKDENLYQLWTQHRVKGLVDRNYITNNLQTLINKYLPKIEATVLIGSLKDTLEKAIEYKEKVNAINDNTDKITELEQDKQRLLNKLNDNEKKIDDLTNQMNKMWEYIKRGEKLEEDKKKLDEYKIPQNLFFILFLKLFFLIINLLS